MRSEASNTPETDESLPTQFARHFLETHGAVVEEKPEGWDALLPGELARQLDLSELVSARRGADARTPAIHLPEKDRSLPIGYGSPLVEKMIGLASDRAPLTTCRVRIDYLKKAGFDKSIADVFSFPNSLPTVQSTAEAKTEYIVFNCWYQAQSDEQQEGMLDLVFNLETAAPIFEMDVTLTGLDRTFPSPGAVSSLDPKILNRLLPKLQKALEDNIAAEIADFRERMKRRYQRDIRHLAEYYESLRQEMEKSLQRPGLTEASIADRKEKIALIPDELARKTHDLLKKYSIRTDVRPCAVLRILTPAVKILIKLTKGKRERSATLFYNPITKTVDPLSCEGCGAGTYRVWLCDPHLHILCPGCRRDCPVCRKG